MVACSLAIRHGPYLRVVFRWMSVDSHKWHCPSVFSIFSPSPSPSRSICFVSLAVSCQGSFCTNVRHFVPVRACNNGQQRLFHVSVFCWASNASLRQRDRQFLWEKELGGTLICVVVFMISHDQGFNITAPGHRMTRARLPFFNANNTLATLFSILNFFLQQKMLKKKIPSWAKNDIHDVQWNS